MIKGDHPEEDLSEVLDDERHESYQIGIYTWICCISRMDVIFAVASLLRFTTFPMIFACVNL